MSSSFILVIYEFKLRSVILIHLIFLYMKREKMWTVYTSIKDITPKTKNWKIKMIVAEKSPKRISQRTAVKYQNLILIDKEV